MDLLLHLLSALLPVLIITTTIPTATAQPLSQKCSSSAGNYTANSTYEANLDRLLASLSTTAPAAEGYSNATVGQTPDRVNGLALCRGDATRSQCQSCLNTASQDVMQLCPYNKGAIIWYDFCMIHFSNQLFFGNSDGSLRLYLMNVNNLTEVVRFNDQLGKLMSGLVRYATGNSLARLFATGEADYIDPFSPTIYGLVQCTRDQPADDCRRCLGGIIQEIPSIFLGKKGARTLTDTCNFRYELYSFYNSSVMVSIPLSVNSTPPPAVSPAQPPPARVPPPAATNTGGKKKTGIILAIAIPLGVALVLIAAICICFSRWQGKMKMHHGNAEEIISLESLLFTLPTLRSATSSFSESNKLGEGGFGSVYKGLLSDGREIAVKRLSAGSGQGIEELKNEVVLLAKLQHRNLVQLLGVCLEEEEKLLVYEYVPNRSLDTILFDPTRREQLYWERRYKIIGGIARGLQYLHEDSQVKIIHRDMKASNILLDADMNPKISDFGLARLFGGDQTQASTTRVVGTYGYMAPEYAMRGNFSNKSDVFSFGVLVLEIITGRKNSSFLESERSVDLLSYVWEHWTNGRVLEIMDPSLGGQCPQSEVLRCIHIGLLCVQEVPADRPSMSTVVLMLNSYSVTLQVPSQPAFLIGYSQASSDPFKKNLDMSRNSPHDSTTRSLLYSRNEVSITELEPR